MSNPPSFSDIAVAKDIDIITDKIITDYPKLCGSCLHSITSHTEYNGHGQFMYCGACQKLCDNIDYRLKHKPSEINDNPIGASSLK